MIEWESKENRRHDYGTELLSKMSNHQGKGRPIVPICGKCLIAYHIYRSLILVKREGVRFYSIVRSSSLDEDPGLKNLSILRKESREVKKISNIYSRFILDYDLFVTAYKKLNFNRSILVSGYDLRVLNEHVSHIITTTIKSLKDHSFQFKSLQYENTSEASGELQSNMISNLKDKLVQKVMVFILQAIFTSLEFSESSSKVHSEKYAQSVLKKVSKWSNIDWFIERSTKDLSVIVECTGLEEVLKKKIQDQQFIDLY